MSDKKHYIILGGKTFYLDEKESKRAKEFIKKKTIQALNHKKDA